jgi:hypothetical protein
VIMTPRSRPRIRLVLIAIFVAAIGQATARADDILDRTIRFHIAASPLSSALIEFSTQSGLQVAAADAEISNLNSNGVNGTFPARVALDMLLHGTGLRFSRVGATTVAISTLPKPAIAAASSTSGSGVAARKPESPQPNPTVADPQEIPDITVTAVRPPTDAELAGNSVHTFVRHHATTHYGNSPGNLQRWAGGLRSICPETVGLTPGLTAFVTARVRALATYVGAPVQSDPNCKSNVEILFTNDPPQSMDKVTKWATIPSLQNKYSGGTRDLIKFTSDHTIQGWYLVGGGALNTTMENLNLDLWPLWPQITQNYLRGTATSILDLMSSSCGTREKPTAITAGDLAFLKVLYYKNSELGRALTRFEIQDHMKRQFELH